MQSIIWLVLTCDRWLAQRKFGLEFPNEHKDSRRATVGLPLNAWIGMYCYLRAKYESHGNPFMQALRTVWKTRGPKSVMVNSSSWQCKQAHPCTPWLPTTQWLPYCYFCFSLVFPEPDFILLLQLRLYSLSTPLISPWLPRPLREASWIPTSKWF